jgi:chloramphenicol 3-O-phosphotransferase
MMKKMIFMICLLITLCTFGQGSLIILNGTSSAGKSTLAKNLQQRLTRSYNIVSIDDFVYPQLLMMAQKLELISVETMQEQQIHQIIAENVGFILASFDKTNQAVNWETLKTGMYQQVVARVKNGENIILDTVLCCAEFESSSSFKTIMADISLCLVLVYCSPMVLVEHVLKRNAQDDYIQRRDVVRVIRSFCNMYEASTLKNDKKIVGCLTDEQVAYLLDRINNSTSDVGCDKQKACQEIQKLLQETFFTIVEDSVSIACRCPYDVCLDLGTMSFMQCAINIDSYLKTSM